VTLYHRSTDPNLKSGTLIGGSTEFAKGPHHRQKGVETVLEAIREKDFPDIPSRLTGTFATLQPATRFSSYGHLYEVEPVGKTLVANSLLIDQMWEAGQSAMSDVHRIYGYGKLTDEQQKHANYAISSAISWEARRYWKGVSVNKSNIRNVEVVADQLKIIRRVDEPHRLMRRMVFKAPTTLTGGAHWDSPERIQRIEADLKSVGCTIEYKKLSYSDRTEPKITIPQGTPIQICTISFMGGGNRMDVDPNDYNPRYDAPLRLLDVLPMGMSRFPNGCDSFNAAQSQEEPLSSIELDKNSIRVVVSAFKKGTLDIISRA